MNFAYGFSEICSEGSNQQYFNIGSDKSFALVRRQVIACTNDG